MDSINMLNKNALKNLLNNYSEELKENDIEGIYKKIHDLNTTDDMKLYLSTLSDSLLSLGFTGEQIIERYGQDIVPKFLFYKCTNLKNIIIPKVKIIYLGAFHGCPNLEKVIIEEGCENIDHYAFFGCENLKEIQLPSTLKHIGICTFFNCKSLKQIVLGKSLIDIGSSAFTNCFNLETIFYEGSEEDWKHVTIAKDTFENHNANIIFLNK